MNLEDRIEDIVRLLAHEGKLGEPFKSKVKGRRDEVRFGTKGSLSIMTAGPRRGRWYDHERQEGGGPWELIKIKGGHKDVAGWLRDHRLDDDGGPPPGGRIIKAYDYTDEQGRVLFQVVRSADRAGTRYFWQRRPDGKGGWIKGRGTARLVLYHLPELVAAKATGNGHPWRVYLCEGEKDADRLREQWGVVATTNPGGAGNWQDDFDVCFADAEVIILEDNDAAGRKRSAKLAPRLARAGAVVRIIRFPHLDEGGDISDWLDGGGSQSDLETVIEDTEPYDPTAPQDPGALVPPGQPNVKSAGVDYGPIAPRQWLLGTNFCRGFLSGLTGAGAAGKTAIRLLQFIALALGRSDLTGEHVFKRTRVLIVCLEDEEEELRRRVRAACIHHGLEQSDLDGWLYYWTPHDLRLLEVDHRGQAEPGELGDALRIIIKGLGIGLVGVDPFVKSHGASENDNNLIDRAASLFLQVAHDCGCACDYVHHHRKGIAIAGDPDSARGAGSLVNASRLVKTATKMSEKEAEGLGLDEGDRKRLVRIDDAKLNIAPPAERTVWFRLVGVDIGNPTEDYPSGDNVQTVERWYPPDAFQGLPRTTIADIFDQLRAGPSEGEFYTKHRNANERWAGGPIAQIANKEKGEADRILKAWIKSDTLIEDDYLSPKRRERIGRVVVNETKAAGILGGLYRAPSAP